jgi:20S proteasome subunit beta 4
MDSIFSICGKDWVIMVCDSAVNRSIFNLKKGEDKIRELDSKASLAMSGEQTDRDTYGTLVTRNLKLNEFQMGHRLNLEGQAQFARTLMAEALRSGPYQVNCLLGGYCDQDKEAKLYWMDYLGTLQRVTKGA